MDIFIEWVVGQKVFSQQRLGSHPSHFPVDSEEDDFSSEGLWSSLHQEPEGPKDHRREKVNKSGPFTHIAPSVLLLLILMGSEIKKIIIHCGLNGNKVELHFKYYRKHLQWLVCYLHSEFSFRSDNNNHHRSSDYTVTSGRGQQQGSWKEEEYAHL